MSGKGDLARVAYSPAEFAQLFGKEQTWGYRQIWAGKVSTITEYGRIMIPAADVERMLAAAGRYNPPKKPAKKPLSKAELWKRIVSRPKATPDAPGKRKRSAALARLRPQGKKREGR